MIRRTYNNNGQYTINLNNAMMEVADYLSGGNCGCSSCIKDAVGGNIFDTIANAMPDIVSAVPIFGPLLSAAAEGTLSLLDPYRKNPRNPRTPEYIPPRPPIFQPSAQNQRYINLNKQIMPYYRPATGGKAIKKYNCDEKLKNESEQYNVKLINQSKNQPKLKSILKNNNIKKQKRSVQFQV
jgi:hypothetical protein